MTGPNKSTETLQIGIWDTINRQFSCEKVTYENNLKGKELKTKGFASYPMIDTIFDSFFQYWLSVLLGVVCVSQLIQPIIKTIFRVNRVFASHSWVHQKLHLPRFETKEKVRRPVLHQDLIGDCTIKILWHFKNIYLVIILVSDF